MVVFKGALSVEYEITKSGTFVSVNISYFTFLSYQHKNNTKSNYQYNFCGFRHIKS